jgi:hypothetical protein
MERKSAKPPENRRAKAVNWSRARPSPTIASKRLGSLAGIPLLGAPDLDRHEDQDATSVVRTSAIVFTVLLGPTERSRSAVACRHH